MRFGLAIVTALLLAGCLFIAIAGPAALNSFADFRAEIVKAAVLSILCLALTFFLFSWLFGRLGMR